MFRMRILVMAASVALAGAMALPASAQWRDSGYGAAQYGGHGEFRQAEDIGYRDGMNDGRRDRDGGHSFRPTHDDNYKNADRGYNGSMGSKQAYKDAYRRGYERGYQEGFGGRRR